MNLSDLPDVTLYGSLPLDERTKEDYFESLYYSSAVVGLNTSAFLEAAIVGRPVHTIVIPEFVERQEGTTHFHYLKSVGGGVLQLARSFDEHRAQLSASLGEPARHDRNERFVTAFIRPRGSDRPATDAVVAALEDLGRMPAPAPAAGPIWAPALRVLLLPLARALEVVVARAENPADRTFAQLQLVRRRDEYRRVRDAEQQRRRSEREAAHLDKVRQVEAARQAELGARQQRIEAARREKDERKATRSRQKAQHQRAKRRAALMHEIKRRIGLERT